MDLRYFFFVFLFLSSFIFNKLFFFFFLSNHESFCAHQIHLSCSCPTFPKQLNWNCPLIGQISYHVPQKNLVMLHPVWSVFFFQHVNLLFVQMKMQFFQNVFVLLFFFLSKIICVNTSQFLEMSLFRQEPWKWPTGSTGTISNLSVML